MSNTTGLSVAQITWQQIELGVKMSLGARNMQPANNSRSLVMSVGPTRRKFEVWITLNGFDLYDITLFNGQKQVWAKTDVFYEALNSTLLRMESENWG
jgi:hypothetical protein